MKLTLTAEQAARFMAKIDRSNPDGCWPWTANTAAGGYGTATIGGRDCRANRVAYVLFNGPIPAGMRVCHSCDNPPCCNPAHLFLGTAKDNSQDMVRKGRSARGERHGCARLTTAEVERIRNEYASGVRQCDLARAFRLSRVHVLQIVRGQRWRHVGGPVVG